MKPLEEMDRGELRAYYADTFGDPDTAEVWAASYFGDDIADIVVMDEPVDRAAARELLTRVALGHDSLTAALAQLRRPAP